MSWLHELDAVVAGDIHGSVDARDIQRLMRVAIAAEAVVEINTPYRYDTECTCEACVRWTALVRALTEEM